MVNKYLYSSVRSIDWYLLAIFLLSAIAIILKSYFNQDGYLSPDSTNYLKLAKNLLEGNGYYVSSYTFTGRDREFFAIWPVGYPTFIFLIAKLTGLSVFWASKILNITLIGIILGIFRALFKKNAYIYGLIFLFGAYIEIFSYTWSETIFITSLLLFSVSIYYFVSNQKYFVALYFSIMMSSLLLFLSRYIGAYSFGLIGLLGMYYGAVKKEKSKSIALIGIAAVNIGMMVAYLYNNFIETGFPTGIQRIPSPETNFQLFIMLVKALVSEVLIQIHTTTITRHWAVIVFLVQFSVLGYILWKYRNNTLEIHRYTNHRPITLSFVFGAIGLVYLLFIILIRWMVQFDGYSYRLLAPGSFLVFISVIYFLQQRASKQLFNAIKGFLIIFSILSYLLNAPYRIWLSYSNTPTYYQTINSIDNEYASVEKDSVIVFGQKHLNYLYTDMKRARPHYFPYYANREKWLDFITRIDVGNNIYMKVPTTILSADKFDQTVIDVVEEYNDGSLVKLR